MKPAELKESSHTDTVPRSAWLVALGAIGLATGLWLVATPQADAASASRAPAAAASASKSTAKDVVAAQDEPDVDKMVADLAAKLERKPNDPDGWRRLARAYTVMDRPVDAIKAFRRVVEFRPRDAQGYVDLARAIGNANDRKITPESESLLTQAVKLDAGNVLAQAMLGKAAFDKGQVGVAKQRWQAALAHLDAKHPFAAQLRQAIQMADAAQAQAAQMPAPGASGAVGTTGAQ